MVDVSEYPKVSTEETTYQSVGEVLLADFLKISIFSFSFITHHQYVLVSLL